MSEQAATVTDEVTANGRLHLAAWELAADPDTMEALLAGMAVPRRKLNARMLEALGEPIDGADVTLDDNLALRVAVALPLPKPTKATAKASPQLPPAYSLTIVPLDDFVSVEEEGASALVGTTDEALIPEGGDVMVYGDGGAGKTTLAIDLGCHLASGDPWLGMPVARPVRVLLIENEGPRPLFRAKLKRKRDGWQGSPLEDRVQVWERPWTRFTFAGEREREALAEKVRELEIDVAIVGPVTRAGMNDAGTLQEVRDFMGLVALIRPQAGRPVTFVLIHHENKGGQVSGAWEGAGDTLLHVQGQGHGRTRVHVQKARWSSQHHGSSLHLLWTEGEGFGVGEKPELDDDTLAEQILAAVSENPGTTWTKVEEATPGVNRKRRREIRDGLLAAGRIVNIVKENGAEVALDSCPERKPSRLYRADDPTIAHLRPDPGADGVQSAPALGVEDSAPSAPCAPPIKGRRSSGADAHPLDEGLEWR